MSVLAPHAHGRAHTHRHTHTHTHQPSNGIINAKWVEKAAKGDTDEVKLKSGVIFTHFFGDCVRQRFTRTESGGSRAVAPPERVTLLCRVCVEGGGSLS